MPMLLQRYKEGLALRILPFIYGIHNAVQGAMEVKWPPRIVIPMSYDATPLSSLEQCQLIQRFN